MWKVIVWKYKTSDPVTHDFGTEADAMYFYNKIIREEDNYNVSLIIP